MINVNCCILSRSRFQGVYFSPSVHYLNAWNRLNPVVESNHFVTSRTEHKQTGLFWINKPHRICSGAKTVALSYSKRKVGVKNLARWVTIFPPDHSDKKTMVINALRWIRPNCLHIYRWLKIRWPLSDCIKTTPWKPVTIKNSSRWTHCSGTDYLKHISIIWGLQNTPLAHVYT